MLTVKVCLLYCILKLNVYILYIYSYKITKYFGCYLTVVPNF